ncbi:MAG TPA: repressor LexA [Firmicutes bacterium]|nr:repressor LexA [Bacillota bacterium]HBG44698.1 repressor LexA [Bacillota bacterium]HBL51352.1 repressor LexA [Bacillota bacterium]HCF90701.1 repressor LexA [Bacillota bacterium]HCT36131.1 repressor LexA [Bacillota bacterium]
MEDLTARQQEILDFIRKEVREKGYPPSVREIGEAVNLSSSSTVHSHLERLEKLGYIRRDPTKPRAIEILSESSTAPAPVINVPLIGRVAAGSPILAEQNVEDIYPLPKDFVLYEDAFMLKVRGDSMIETGIFDGDLVVVRRTTDARNGEIVVALVGEEATVKRFFREKDCIRLQPENSAMEPIMVKDVTILGKVTGLLRKIH